MPTPRDHHKGILCGLILVGLLAGCAAVEPRDQPEPPTRPALLQELSSLVPGQYATPARASGGSRLALEVSVDPAAPADQLRLVMTQTRLDRPDEPPRRFHWRLVAAEQPGELTAEFAPLDAAGRAQRRCDMTVNARTDGITAQTDPEQCRFGEGEQLTGLLKEIAFDGSQLIIGDRLVGLPAGEPLGEDQITRFVRHRRFTGWAGVHEHGAWRMSPAVALSTGDSREPLDAARMSLGLVVELNHYLMDRSDQVMLRLTVLDAHSGDLIGEAWADADARSIGLALPELQVGLEADR